MLKPSSALTNRFSNPMLTLSASAGSNTGILQSVLAAAPPLPLVTGYGTLTCDQPVVAYAFYIQDTVQGRTAPVSAGAAVFSSPPTTRAQVQLYSGSFQNAFAIANDTDDTAQYQVTVYDQSGAQITTTTLSVPARSNTATFLRQIAQIPSTFAGGSMVVTSSSSSPFSIVSLVFAGNVFFSQPAVTLPVQ